MMPSSCRVWLSILCLASLAATSRAAEVPRRLEPPAVERLVEAHRRFWHVPGVAVALVEGDEVTLLKGFGTRQVGSAAPVTPDTLFAAGSLTKAFTTTALAMLADEGRLAWDDPVRKHIEFFQLADPLASENVTLRDIVSHRTGLSRHDLLWLQSGLSREELLRRIGRVKLSRPFRESYQYQNLMYLAAGYALEQAARTRWEEFVRNRLLMPLEMSHTNFSTAAAEAAADHATPHRLRDDDEAEVVPWVNLENIAPAGAINASVRDLSHWMQFQLNAGTYHGMRLVSHANLLETQTPQTIIRIAPEDRANTPHTVQMSYGMGWVIQDFHGRRLVSHGGNISGFTARLALLPDQHVGIVTLANLRSTRMNEALTYTLLEMALGESSTDWSLRLQEQTKRAAARQATAAKERLARRHLGTRPARELTAYAGVYADPAYGKVVLSVREDSLFLEWNATRSLLEHFHFDTFTAKEGLLEGEDLSFILGADGEVARLAMLGVEFKRMKMPAAAEKMK